METSTPNSLPPRGGGSSSVPPPPSTNVNVQVVVRCRPSSQEERSRGVPEIVLVDPLSDEVRVMAPIKAGEKLFSYDRVFNASSSQAEVYEKSVEPLVQQTLRGFNTTVLAYGQTGTGKTHTMEGTFDDLEEMGIIPRALQSIFRQLDLRGDSDSYVKASYLEIYNENLTDLLSSVNSNDLLPNQQLRIVEDKNKKGIVVHNLEEVLIKSYEDVRRVMKTAMAKRHVAQTDLNERSSRSHAVFTVTVYSKEKNLEGEELLRVGKLNLVDLAGSECVAKSGSKDIRAREAGSINQSLLTLGRVITALVEKSPHISYRDSKLTRLLQESLGGCSLTLMIATVAPSVTCLDETLSTLEYASRAKSIKNKPMANQKTTKRAAIKEYVEEIERLRQELQSARAKDGVYLSEDQYHALQMASKSSSSRASDLEACLEKRMTEIAELRQHCSTTKAELSRLNLELDAERDRLNKTKEDLKRKQGELEEEKKLGEERQAIVDAHVAVESRLHHVHDELQDRLKVAKDRIGSLHDKIDRKQLVEQENDRICRELKQLMTNKLQETQAQIRDGKSVTLENMVKVQEFLIKVESLVTEDLGPSSQKHRNRILECSKESLNRTLEVTSKSLKADLVRVEKEGSANSLAFFEATQNFDQANKGHQDTVSMISNARDEETRRLREFCIEPLMLELERSRQSERTLMDTLQFSLQSLREASQELIAEYKGGMESFQQDLRTKLDSEKQRSKQSATLFAQRVSAMLDEMEGEREVHLDAVVNATQIHVQDSNKRGSDRAETVNNCVHLLLEGNQAWFSKECQQKQSIVQNAREKDELAEKAFKTAQEAWIELSQETVSFLQTGSSETQANQSRVENAMDVLMGEMMDRERLLLGDHAQILQSLDALKLVAMQEEKLLEQQGVILVQQAEEELDFLQEGTTEFCQQTSHTLEASQMIINEFALKQDRCTGKSPSKLQILEWSKERPYTLPHSMIVERARKSRAEPKMQMLGDIEENVAPLVVSLPTTSFNKTRTLIMGERDMNSNVEDEGVESMKVEELRSALKEKGQSSVGNKEALKQRLKATFFSGEE